MTTYRHEDLEVRGGRLRVGIWQAGRPDGTDAGSDVPPVATVLAVHGVTSSHLVWELVARRLTRHHGVRVVAPDLRGRGRSALLPGPWGMASHAADLHAVARAYGPFDVAVGHSMGAFCCVQHAADHPDDAGSLVLVDGGVPLTRPDGMSTEAALHATIGPAAERLAMTFPDRAAYRAFWRAHPAFAGVWSAELDAYVDYDLVERRDGWHSVSSADAVSQDSADQFAGGAVDQAWSRLRLAPTFLRAPLGLLAEPPGLYPPEALYRFAGAHPGFEWTDVVGANHYTVVLGEPGADLVAATVAARLGVVTTV